MTSSPGQAAACARYEQQRTPLFSLGTVLITPGALDMLEALQLAPLPFVLRHVAGDWGDLCQEDKEANAAALTYGSRLLSAYDIPPNHRLWIITESDRRSTTLLLPGNTEQCCIPTIATPASVLACMAPWWATSGCMCARGKWMPLAATTAF